MADNSESSGKGNQISFPCKIINPIILSIDFLILPQQIPITLNIRLPPSDWITLIFQVSIVSLLEGPKATAVHKDNRARCKVRH
jgi:hypothetical protein